MAIVNGYCTLDQAKARLLDTATYGASTISFVASTKKIVDSAAGLKRFLSGMRIRVTGSVSNNNVFTVATGDTAGEIVVLETVVDGAAGPAVTITDVTALGNDEILERVIEEVSRFIDDWCNTRFYTVAETRYYTAEECDCLYLDDLIALTSLQTDADGDRTYENTWQATDFDLVPFNAALDGKPYNAIETTPKGIYLFPEDVNKGVKVIGTFGYFSSVPPQVRAATLLMVNRLYERTNAPFGVTGSPAVSEMIAIMKVDPDFEILLRKFKNEHRQWVV